MMGNDLKTEKRFSERFCKEEKVIFYFNYDLITKMDVTGTTTDKKEVIKRKYPACSKNISAEGLCFTSLEKPKQGDLLDMEMYFGESIEAVKMKGRVRWCQPACFLTEDDGLFDTGVKLQSVEGEGVDNSIHYDENYHLVWSNVLEKVLGNIKRIASDQKESK